MPTPDLFKAHYPVQVRSADGALLATRRRLSDKTRYMVVLSTPCTIQHDADGTAFIVVPDDLTRLFRARILG